MEVTSRSRAFIVAARLSSSVLAVGCAASPAAFHASGGAPEPACVAGTSARWPVPDSGLRRLRVWVQAVPSADGPGAASVGAAIPDDALGRWNRLGLPVRFTRAPSRGRADIRVDVLDRFFSDDADPGNATRGGVTRLTVSGRSEIEEAQIMIARHTAVGGRYSDVDLEAILLHELGHAIGLRHSSNPLSIMAPQPVVSTVTSADASTARALYGGARCATVRAERADGDAPPR